MRFRLPAFARICGGSQAAPPIRSSLPQPSSAAGGGVGGFFRRRLHQLHCFFRRAVQTRPPVCLSRACLLHARLRQRTFESSGGKSVGGSHAAPRLTGPAVPPWGHR